jgi:hypothetical protein
MRVASVRRVSSSRHGSNAPGTQGVLAGGATLRLDGSIITINVAV